jgi:hypothetical protein
MLPTNERGQYGSRRPVLHVGADAGAPGPAGHPIAPWLVGGIGLAVVGLAIWGSRTARRPRLSAHEKEVRAWEAEFPGLPWYMDQVKDARQLDMWERARDHWERAR